MKLDQWSLTQLHQLYSYAFWYDGSCQLKHADRPQDQSSTFDALPAECLRLFNELMGKGRQARLKGHKFYARVQKAALSRRAKSGARRPDRRALVARTLEAEDVDVDGGEGAAAGAAGAGAGGAGVGAARVVVATFVTSAVMVTPVLVDRSLARAVAVGAVTAVPLVDTTSVSPITAIAGAAVTVGAATVLPVTVLSWVAKAVASVAAVFALFAVAASVVEIETSAVIARRRPSPAPRRRTVVTVTFTWLSGTPAFVAIAVLISAAVMSSANE